SGSFNHPLPDERFSGLVMRAAVTRLIKILLSTLMLNKAWGISLDGQLQTERAALSLCTLHRDGAAHEIDIALDDRQAEPRVHALGMTRAIGPVESLKNVLAFLGSDTDAGVPNLELQGAVLAFDGEIDAAIWL